MYKRQQVHSNTRVSAVQFDKKLEVKQTLTGELLSGLPQALENGEFKDVYKRQESGGSHDIEYAHHQHL